MEQEQLKDMMYEAFCTSHLPWVVTDHPDFKLFLETLNRTKIHFRIPNRENLCTNIIHRVQDSWESQIKNVKAAWDVTGITIACDGWTNAVG